MSYFNFDLKLFGERTQGFYVEVAESPQSVRSDAVPLTLPKDMIARWRELVGGGHDSQHVNEELGRALHAALFPPAILDVWRKGQRCLGARDSLRLRLDVRSSELSSVPWELIHDGSWHLTLTGEVPVVRHLFDHPLIPSVEGVHPLNILLLTATPRDAPPLPEAEDEAEAIRHSFSGGEAGGDMGVVTVLPHVTKERLRRQLQQHEYHVLHFIGHGEFADDNGYLVFEDDGGSTELVDGQTLGYRFSGTALRLLFLNSCKSAMPSHRGALLGVAQAALAAGVPAAVAMQDVILDTAAAAFAREFYLMLAAGWPLEVCAAEGRRGIAESVGRHRPDWAIPVLFSNAQDGLLWRDPGVNEGEVDAPSRMGDYFGPQTINSQGDGNTIGQKIVQTNYYYAERRRKRD